MRMYGRSLPVGMAVDARGLAMSCPPGMGDAGVRVEDLGQVRL